MSIWGLNYQGIASLWRQAHVRYVIIGGSVFIFELLIIQAGIWLGLPSVVAVAIAFWVALLASFVLQKVIAFGDGRFARRLVGRQFAAYCVLVAANFAFTIVLTALLSSLMPAVLCRAIALLITTLWNYYVYKAKIFTPSVGRQA